jgi:hypothetical protein
LIRTTRLALLTLAIGFAAAPGVGKNIQPSEVFWSARARDLPDGKICEIVLDTGDPRTGEMLEFIAVVATTRTEHPAALAGFAMGVAEAIPRSAKVKRVKLSIAHFASKIFDSGSLPHEFMEDGTVWTWTGPETVQAFLGSFLRGNFQLTFSRVGSAETRTYQIGSGPPLRVSLDFMECIIGTPPLPEVSFPHL